MQRAEKAEIINSYRAFAFIDILGFAKLVRQSGADPRDFEKVRAFVDAGRLIAEWFDWHKIGQASLFSDTILVSVDGPEHKLVYLLREVGMLARYLLLCGFACRGGITVGAVYHQGPIAVGPALVTAYELEQRAMHPRILVDAAAMSLWEQEVGPNSSHPSLSAWVKCDRDGEFFLSLFSSQWSAVMQMSDIFHDARRIPDDPESFCGDVAARIVEGCSDADPRVRSKWEWLASEHREQSG